MLVLVVNTKHVMSLSGDVLNVLPLEGESMALYNLDLSV